MEKLIETLFGGLFGAAVFFANLKARRTDDPILTEYKAKQRACVHSLLAAMGVLVIGTLTVNLIPETLSTGPAGQAFSVLLRYVGMGFAVFMLGAFLWLVITWASLYRFIRNNGIE